MDFFAHQDSARKKTSVLVCYFFVAVLLIVASVYAAVAVVVLVGKAKMNRSAQPQLVSRPIGPEALWDPQLFFWVACGTIAVIALGTLYKISELGGGGETVARMLGGRRLESNTQNLDERVLLNVVEEMAIAAGIAVPPVFLLEHEAGINAFAAGFSPNDAVIGVTHGAIETLSRDELQGVIAHEFSHILNGDMRLNIRLMGVLHGILLIALIGYGILRSLQYGSGSSGGDKKGGGAAVMIAMLTLGVAFLAIGWVGVFFGRLIKAAVSRQREYLADASAVQFTRDPNGIAGALKKIGGLAFGSRMKTAKAEQASHMFFGNALRTSFLGLLSTHPPLRDRIGRIDPTFDGEFSEVSRVKRTARDLHREQLTLARGQQTAAIRARAEARTPTESRAAAFAFEPQSAVASVGTLGSEHVAYAGGLVDSLPERLVLATHEPLGAVAAIYCLLLDSEPATRRVQIQCLAEHADHRAYQEAQRLVTVMDLVTPEARLPLVEMAMPALCQLSGVQYFKFCETVERLVEADQQISLFEFALQRMIVRHLAPRFVPRRPPRVKYVALRPLLPTCASLLSTLAYVGQPEQAEAERAFALGAATLEIDGDRPELEPKHEAGLKRLDDAIDRVAAASPQIKKRVLEACAATIGADGRVTVEEAELLRVLAVSLDCPMPPLLAAQTA